MLILYFTSYHSDGVKFILYSRESSLKTDLETRLKSEDGIFSLLADPPVPPIPEILVDLMDFLFHPSIADCKWRRRRSFWFLSFGPLATLSFFL